MPIVLFIAIIAAVVLIGTLVVVFVREENPPFAVPTTSEIAQPSATYVASPVTTNPCVFSNATCLSMTTSVALVLSHQPQAQEPSSRLNHKTIVVAIASIFGFGALETWVYILLLRAKRRIELGATKKRIKWGAMTM